MQKVLALCRKELTQFQRDRLTLALAFLLPMMTLIILGSAIRLEAKGIPITIQDLDISPLSRSYIERIFATNQLVAVSKSTDDPEQAIAQGLAKAAIIIPPDFASVIQSGKSIPVQILVDATDTNNARIIQNIVRATTRSFLQDAGIQSITERIKARIRVWFNPGRREALYIVPGLYGLILWVYPSLLSAIAMVREKEQATILQIYASSLSATELLLGKGLAYLIIAISEAVFVMICGALIWGLGIAGDPTTLLIGTLCFIVDAVVFGLLIGVRTTNQNAAVQAVALIGFLTALLLSGFIYPLSNIPFPLSFVSNIIPARYYIEISRDAYVRGSGWLGIWQAMLMLIILGLGLFNAARLSLKKMQLPN